MLQEATPVGVMDSPCGCCAAEVSEEVSLENCLYKRIQVWICNTVQEGLEFFKQLGDAFICTGTKII